MDENAGPFIKLLRILGFSQDGGLLTGTTFLCHHKPEIKPQVRNCNERWEGY
jgi:hypothetical protein